MVRNTNRYTAIIENIFHDKYKENSTEFTFNRDEITETAKMLGLEPPKNIGDLVYSFRYRSELPDTIKEKANAGFEWIIEGAGKAIYRFKQVKFSRILPRDDLISIKIPDATPEIIISNTLGDEQALLARLRYNRLIDLFLGIVAYSLQNHLRTTVKGRGQIEIDEIYIGVDSNGQQFVIPVQAKGGTDKHGITQTEQDILFCKQKFPSINCRAVSAQFMANDRIAMFELAICEEGTKVLREKHYTLVPYSEISSEDLKIYQTL